VTVRVLSPRHVMTAPPFSLEPLCLVRAVGCRAGIGRRPWTTHGAWHSSHGPLTMRSAALLTAGCDVGGLASEEGRSGAKVLPPSYGPCANVWQWIVGAGRARRDCRHCRCRCGQEENWVSRTIGGLGAGAPDWAGEGQISNTVYWAATPKAQIRTLLEEKTILAKALNLISPCFLVRLSSKHIIRDHYYGAKNERAGHSCTRKKAPAERNAAPSFVTTV